MSIQELYAIMQVRNDVFVYEQHCYYQDLDDKDQACIHVLGWNEQQKLVAYCRILPPGLTYPTHSIGRVLVISAYRKQQLGRALMQKTLDYILSTYGKVPLTIEAQLYLQAFYESLSFVRTSDVFDDAGIDHVEMQLHL
ncbi:MAG: GNAT family N-acetyltransferase [Bacteroidota bacterium]